jgi:hypothetical protein
MALDVGELEPGHWLDCMVSDLLYDAYETGAPVLEFSTDYSVLSPVLQYLAHKSRYFGLMHSYDGTWLAVSGDCVDDMALFGAGIDEDDEGTAITFLGETPAHAACGLAVKIGYGEKMKLGIGS